jgi:hypothetical protein
MLWIRPYRRAVHKGRRIFLGYSMMSIFLNFARPVVFWSTMVPMPFSILIVIPRLESFIDFLDFFQPPCLFKPPCLLILQLLYPLLVYSLLLGYYRDERWDVFFLSNLTSEKSLIPVLSKFFILTEMAGRQC